MSGKDRHGRWQRRIRHGDHGWTPDHAAGHNDSRNAISFGNNRQRFDQRSSSARSQNTAGLDADVSASPGLKDDPRWPALRTRLEMNRAPVAHAHRSRHAGRERDPGNACHGARARLARSGRSHAWVHSRWPVLLHRSGRLESLQRRRYATQGRAPGCPARHRVATARSSLAPLRIGHDLDRFDDVLALPALHVALTNGPREIDRSTSIDNCWKPRPSIARRAFATIRGPAAHRHRRTVRHCHRDLGAAE
jgi:hypothetical protein